MTDTASPVPLEETLLSVAQAERLARAKVTVKNYTLGSAALALLPVPLVDQLALMGLEVKLVHDLAKLYDVSFRANVVRTLLSALLSGFTSGLLTKSLQSLAKTIPLLGTLGGGGGIALSFASVTYAVGSVFIKHFEADGTLLTIDTDWFKKVFHQVLKQEDHLNGEITIKESHSETPVAAAT
jgi:uncharacterized protein (DUF697 family)